MVREVEGLGNDVGTPLSRTIKEYPIPEKSGTLCELHIQGARAPLDLFTFLSASIIIKDKPQRWRILRPSQ